MPQRVNIYLKSILVNENGHYRGGVEGTNLLLATWKQPNFQQDELTGGGALQLQDYDAASEDTVFTPPKNAKWRLFKCEVDGDSEIEFLVTNKIEIPKSAKWLLGKLADNLDEVAGVPLVGKDLVGLLKDVGEHTYQVAVGSLAVPSEGLEPRDYSVALTAGQNLYVLPEEPARPVGQRGRLVNRRATELAQKAGTANGKLVVSVEVV